MLYDLRQQFRMWGCKWFGHRWYRNDYRLRYLYRYDRCGREKGYVHG